MLSTEGNKSDAYLAKEVIVSVVAWPKVPTPLNCRLPFTTAFPAIIIEAAFICPVTANPPCTINAPVEIVVEFVPDVMAKPDTERIFVDELNDKDASAETAAPDDEL